MIFNLAVLLYFKFFNLVVNTVFLLHITYYYSFLNSTNLYYIYIFILLTEDSRYIHILRIFMKRKKNEKLFTIQKYEVQIIYKKRLYD